MRLLTLLLIISSFAWTINAWGDVSRPSRDSFTMNGTNFRVWYRYNYNTGYYVALIEFNRPGDWFMVGWGNTDDDVDAWVFQLDGNRVLSSDRYWGNTRLPVRDVALGGTYDLQLLGYLVQRNRTLVKIRRRINTGDRYDKVLTRVRYTYWAWGQGPRLTTDGLQRGRVVRR